MVEVTLSFPTPEGTQQISIEAERTTFGRGSDAAHRFPDNGLSRLHATIYRDGDRVWIVDENSSNGTFVNGQRTAPAGTPLNNGDQVKIGNETFLTVHIRDKKVLQASVPAPMPPRSTSVSSVPAKPINFVPIILIGLAFMIVSISVVFVAFKVIGRNDPDVVQTADDDDPIDIKPSKSDKDNKKPDDKSTPSETKNTSGNDEIRPDTPVSEQKQAGYTLPAGKKYLDLSDTERRAYLADRAMRVAQIIGNNSSDPIPAAALDKIKGFTDGYAKRINSPTLTGKCRFADSLQATYERASKNAPFIIRAFNQKGTDPRIGLYLAMIESEHCVCLQSPTGPLGMFQFTFSTAKLHFEPSEGVVKGASPENPDDRCKPEPAAHAAASYMKALTGRYGTGPASVPLAIGSYNSGEGGLSTNLQKALDSNTGLPRDFWTLIANGEILSKQFQSENFKYVPKFFAAAIIGENPADFGLKLQPISTYTK